jgi:hypothetical protein
VIFLALGLIGFGLGDLVRWSLEDEVGNARVAVAAGSGAAAIGLVAALSGMAWLDVLVTMAVGLPVLVLWVGYYDLLPPRKAKPRYALGLLMATIIGLIAVSGAADPIRGEGRPGTAASTSALPKSSRSANSFSGLEQPSFSWRPEIASFASRLPLRMRL